MKVVLFCGGMGTRLREHSDTIPKPLVNIGYRPIVWHLMRYYAHFGHKDFILCLGYRGDMIREYFLKYDECLSNDFVMSEGGRKVEPIRTDIHDWRITFVNTGLHSNIGQRLLRVREFVKDEPYFLANYADALSDLPLNDHIDAVRESGKVAGLLAVAPSQSFHCIQADDAGVVESLRPMDGMQTWINAGYFCLRQDIFDYIEEGDELVDKPFQRLIERKLLLATRYRGFWQQMDTLKDKIAYDRLEARGKCPWMVWQPS